MLTVTEPMTPLSWLTPLTSNWSPWRRTDRMMVAGGRSSTGLSNWGQATSFTSATTASIALAASGCSAKSRASES